MKLKKYNEFIAEVKGLGEYVVPDYDAETKQEILGDFADVFADEPDEILSRYIDEFLETAEWVEARIFPKPEIMMVHAEATFPNSTGEMVPVQVYGLWNCFMELLSWSVLVECGHKDIDPEMQYAEHEEQGVSDDQG